MRARGLAQVGIAASLWGLWPLLLKPTGATGPQAAFVTLMVMALPTPFVFRPALLKDRAATLAVLGVGVFDALNAGLYFSALRAGPVVVAVLTHYLAPLLVALTAPWFLGEARSHRAVFAAPLVLGGLAMVIGPPGDGFPIHTAFLGAGSAVFYAGVVICSKRAAPTWSPLQVTALHSPISVVLVLMFFQGDALPSAFGEPLLRLVLAAGLAGLLATSFFNTGLRRIPAHVAGVLTYLEPLVAAAVGVLFLDNPLTPLTMMGGLLVLGAGVWVASENPSPSVRPRSPS